MRVLVVHNAYRSAVPSGENRSVIQEVAALRHAGLSIDLYERQSDEIPAMNFRQRISLAWRPVWSAPDARAIADRIRRTRPDVVHVHNVIPLISPAVVHVAASHGVPVVQAVRNYRFTCAAATCFRDGALCADCVGRRVPWPAVWHGCYRRSPAQTLPVAASIAAHPIARQPITRFLPVSQFVAQALRRAGVDASRITVKPNFVPDPGVSDRPASAGDHVLMIGRLDQDKGIRLLTDAWAHLLRTEPPPGRLVCVGDGPGRNELADAGISSLEVHPPVHSDAVDALIAQARAVVVPSMWHEAFGRTAIEAFARGRPVIATDRGGLAEVVDGNVGWSIPAAPTALADALRQALTDDHAVDTRGHAARRRYVANYTPDATVSALRRVYAEITKHSSANDSP